MKLKISIKYIAFFCALFTAIYASAQMFQNSKQTNFEFINSDAASIVLGAEDEYVSATAEMERKAKTRSAQQVDKSAFLQYMRLTARDWTDNERAKIESELPSLEKFITQIAWDKPKKLQFIRANATLEDNLPHTRGTAVILPDSAFSMPRAGFASLLAHEVFHVLTRYNKKLKDSSYQLIQFERCENIFINPKIDQLKITNPDTPLSQHTISVKHKGQHVNALPFIGFDSLDADTSTGFINKLSVRWLLVKRENNQCSLSSESFLENSATPDELDGLFEKIGKNTEYLFHAEEILAENFAALYMASLGGKQIASYPSERLLLDFKSLLQDDVGK